MPGFEVLPSSVNATSVTATAADTLTVRFRYAPTTTVIVAINSEKSTALMVNPSILQFTPQNYSNSQVVSIRGTPAASHETVNVNFSTASSDGVFSNLFDQWAYRATRLGTQALTAVQAGTQTVVVAQNSRVSFSLNAPGAVSNSTAMLAPVHGTLFWAGTNLTYTPVTNYCGDDSLAYWATNGTNLKVGAVQFVVVDPEAVAPFELWAALYNLPATGGHTNDTDHDGYVDLLEYGWGSRPDNSSSIPRLEASSDATGARFGVIGFSRYVNATDISFYVESRTELVPVNGWNGILSNVHAVGWNGAASYTESAPTDGVASVKVTDPNSSPASIFMRVKIKKD
jgi:hypothetical protein